MLNSFSKLESSKVYKSWKKKNKDSFLCSCFFTDDEKIDFDEALKIMDNIKNQKYKSENVLRKIVVLQYIKRQLWNMTFLMSSLNLLNVRIDSESGKALS